MHKSDTVFDRVKYNALDFLGLYQEPPNDLRLLMSSIVGQRGTIVFRDTALLRQAMADAGASESDICRMCLMTQVSGFQEVLRQNPQTIQADLDRYVQNAASETGLNRDMILDLTGSIVFAAGGSVNCDLFSAPEVEFSPQTVAVLATSLYEKPLREFSMRAEPVLAGRSKEILNFSIIESLANVGIPRAKFYMGIFLLRGLQLEKNVERGVQLLEEAASMGDSRAAAALGDYHYDLANPHSWETAYHYYTGVGAAALNRRERGVLTNILNQKIFNRKLLTLCAVLLALSVITVLWAPGAAAYAPQRMLGCAAAAVQLALLAVGILHHRAKPYDSLYWVPVGISAVWTLYMAARFLLGKGA